MRKILCIISVLLFFDCLIAQNNYDFSSVNSDGQTLYYTITSANNYTVGVVPSFTYKTFTSINIPSTVYYNGHNYTITRLIESAFSTCLNLSNVTLPNTIIDVGGSAFATCLSLTSILLPNGLKKIGVDAFAAAGLTSITIPQSVDTIGYRSFGNCAQLTLVNYNASNIVYEIYQYKKKRSYFYICSNV